MKKKNIEKKMDLNKATIANLDWKELNEIRGGTGGITTMVCSSYDCTASIILSCGIGICGD
jgi:hypothetical protein